MVRISRSDKGKVDELKKEFLAESYDGLDRMELCLTELEKRPDDGELVPEIFRTVHTIKGTTGFLGFGRLQTLAHTGEGLLVAIRDGKIVVTSDLISGLLALTDGLRGILQLIEETGTEGERSTDDDRELISLLKMLKAGAAVSAAKEEATPSELEVGNQISVATRGAASSAQHRTLRIDVEVLNRMMNLVGELVLTRNQILQTAQATETFSDLARRLNNVTSELRESVMQVRMQPLGHLFGKFPRLVRDLAKSCGRKVRIEFEGQETGLDKSLLEAVRDPLTHAVRNAVDHGIEPPEVRVKAGKPAEGVVRLRAFQQSGSVAIEVIDDGAGISAAQILDKAIERGVVTAEQAKQITPREALQLIFLAGISLSPVPTNISGRGVGMDVVRTNVELVGGSVEVESQVGSGTTVRMRVPLTLAIVPALVVRSGRQIFALPQGSLTELVHVPARDAETAVERIGTAKLYRLREGLLPLVWLDRLLGLERQTPEKRGFYIAALEAGGRRFGLVVDDLRAPEEIVVKPLSSCLREIGMFSGATVLGDGMLALILDVAAIGARAGMRTVSEADVLTGGGPPLQRAWAAPGSEAKIEMDRSMLVYELEKKGEMEKSEPETIRHVERMAMPLSAVERIARVPLNTIEYADGRAMLQYEGDLLPLEDGNGVLADLEAARAPMATVLICLRPAAQGARRVGLVVQRVLEVSAGRMLEADAGGSNAQLAMVQNRVTKVNREFAWPLDVSAMLQEVA
jgi:two-component system chemotaxis sensor kinase CheA